MHLHKGTQVKFWYLLGEDDGHCIIQHALPKQECVQVWVDVQFMEDGQHRHWGNTHTQSHR